MDSTALDLSAAQNVLNIDELLILILANLDTTQLTQALRVCSKWKNLILDSKRLRQIMYLEAEPVRMKMVFRLDKEARKFACDSSRWKPHIQHLDKNGNAFPSSQSEQSSGTTCTVTSPTSYVVSTLHPILESGLDRLCYNLAEVVIRLDAFLAWHPGRWTQMLLTQPPCSSIIIRSAARAHRSRDRSLLRTVRCNNDRGITFGMLDEVFRDELRKERNRVIVRRQKVSESPGEYLDRILVIKRHTSDLSNAFAAAQGMQVR